MPNISELQARSDLRTKLARQMVLMCQLALLLLGLGIVARPDLPIDHSSHTQTASDLVLAIHPGDRRDELRVYFTTEKRTAKKWRFEPQHDLLAAKCLGCVEPSGFAWAANTRLAYVPEGSSARVYEPRAPPVFLI